MTVKIIRNIGFDSEHSAKDYPLIVMFSDGPNSGWAFAKTQDEANEILKQFNDELAND